MTLHFDSEFECPTYRTNTKRRSSQLQHHDAWLYAIVAAVCIAIIVNLAVLLLLR